MPILLDSNILLDIFTEDKEWYGWSSETLAKESEDDLLYINPIIYSEISISFDTIETLEAAIPGNYILREDIPYEAAFLAGKCFVKYRKSGGTKQAPLPDFFIGAHAAVRNWSLMTRDKGRFQTYFPTIDIICPLLLKI